MAYSAAEARQEILDRTAEAADHLGAALAALGAAYELVDEATGDRLERALFRPVQVAYATPCVTMNCSGGRSKSLYPMNEGRKALARQDPGGMAGVAPATLDGIDVPVRFAARSRNSYALPLMR